MEAVIIEGIVLVAVVAVVREFGIRTGLPDTLLLLVIGGGFSFVPGVPSYHVSPEVVLVVVLPLLLYAAAFTASVPAIRANLRSIGLLSFGLTVFTTVVVGYVAYLVIPGIPLVVAMVLGAVVAPSDAVAAVAIGRGAGMPPRLVTILEGESLFNDAAALTVYKVAVAAVVTGSFGVAGAAGQFAIAAAGGLAVGAAVGAILGWIRNRLHNPLSDTALSLLAPFVAYLPAESFGGSGLVAVVTAGLYLGHRAPSVMDAPSRLAARSVWQVIEHLLSGTVFVLIGLQLADIVARLGDYPPSLLAAASAAVVAAMVGARVVWMYPGAYVPPLLSRRLREREGRIPWQEPAVAAWAGLRGVVSLAAAFAIPATAAGGGPFPARNLLLFLTFVAIATSLLAQGLTLPAVVRTLQPPATERTSRADQEAAAHRAAEDAELQQLDGMLAHEEPPAGVEERLRERAERRRQLTGTTDESVASEESPIAAYGRFRKAMLAAARRCLVRMRDGGEISEEVFTRVQRDLDLEETILRGD